MGFIKISFYLYSKINSFEYSKVKERALSIQTKFKKVLRAKYDLLPFLRYNQNISK